MAPKRDLEAAKLRRLGIDESMIDGLKKDKEHAERLAKLAANAMSRKAAPLPPGKAPPPQAKKEPEKPAEPAKVGKYRAIDDFNGDDISFEKGATIFVVGEPDSTGMVQGVAGGKAGKLPMSKLRLITPELLEEERIQREKDIEAQRIKDEEELRKEMERLKLEAENTNSAPDSSATTSTGGKSAEQIAYEKELEEKFEKEREELLAEEEKLKAEAARIEAMLAALDDNDEE
eukprot:m.21141 g.21141  ORF g.21141 m.21141 type:complete len:232 (+) comp8688_c0_seq1:280-975(+)